MEFSIAARRDLPEVQSLYRAAIARMREQGIDQWDAIYPAADVLEADVTSGEMEVGRLEGAIRVAFSLSERCDAEYTLCAWRYPEARCCVLHRLCVHPEAQGRGVAGETMAHIESALLLRGYETLRLDAFSQNPYALRLYENLGYERVGEVRFRKGLFYFYEKWLNPNSPVTVQRREYA